MLPAEDVEALLAACAHLSGLWPNPAIDRVRAALHAAKKPAAEADDAPLPPGRWGRVELPGYREDTGWLAEETRFGQVVIVVRDWNGAEVANAIIGPMCRVVYLPTPLRRPEPRAALPAASEPDVWDAESVEDDQSGGSF